MRMRWPFPSQSGTIGHFNHYLAFHVVLGPTAFQVDSTTYKLPVPPNASVESFDTINPYMGFSQSLLLLINQTTELAWMTR
jgi:hypothetical protein